jgi:aminoglycoside phosphotransferase (APT) family kinase protein
VTIGVGRPVAEPAGLAAHDQLPLELRTWVRGAVSGQITRVAQLSGGNRRQAWLVDAVSADGELSELFLRYEPSSSAAADDPYTLWREARICTELADLTIPTPAIHGVHPTVQAVLMGRVPGEASLRAVADEPTRTAIASDFMRHLAALHQTTQGRFTELSDLASPTVRDCVVHELDVWEGMYRRSEIDDPLAELAFRWLRRALPDVGARPVLVHGDAGPGNFLFADGRITAIVDWELAHLGDPMEDLAWLSLRTAQEGFPDFGQRIAEYERFTATEIDPARIRYHRVFAELRIVVLRLRALRDPRPSGEIGNSVLSAGLHRRLCVEALAECAGVALPDAPDLEETADQHEWISRGILREIRDITERSDDPVVIAEAKGIARAVKFLDGRRQFGPAADRADCRDLAILLGHEIRDAAAGHGQLAARVRSGQFSDQEVIAYLAANVARENLILAKAMGALARRHLPPVGGPDHG